VIQDVVVNPFREGADVDEFVRVEAAVGRGGDVADVVTTGATGGETQFLDTRENRDERAGPEFAQLEITARGDVDEAVAQLAREIGEAVALGGSDLTGRDAEAQHEAVLGGRDVEEAVEFETAGVFGVGKFVGVGVGEEAFPGVEGILVVFPPLFFAEIGEGRAVDGGLVGVRCERRSEVGRGGGGG